MQFLYCEVDIIILLFPVAENYDYYHMLAHSLHLYLPWKWHNIAILQMENENFFKLYPTLIGTCRTRTRKI